MTCRDTNRGFAGNAWTPTTVYTLGERDETNGSSPAVHHTNTPTQGIGPDEWYAQRGGWVSTSEGEGSGILAPAHASVCTVGLARTMSSAKFRQRLRACSHSWGLHSSPASVCYTYTQMQIKSSGLSSRQLRLHALHVPHPFPALPAPPYTPPHPSAQRSLSPSPSSSSTCAGSSAAKSGPPQYELEEQRADATPIPGSTSDCRMATRDPERRLQDESAGEERTLRRGRPSTATPQARKAGRDVHLSSSLAFVCVRAPLAFVVHCLFHVAASLPPIPLLRWLSLS
ncbi:hypothetical protein DFH09DRAFT_1380343 [Mycena vulgaris]|nr:hypothetical protein DFH09DRAFT_1380343 [Mycena vulgaris]